MDRLTIYIKQGHTISERQILANNNICIHGKRCTCGYRQHEEKREKGREEERLTTVDEEGLNAGDGHKL